MIEGQSQTCWGKRPPRLKTQSNRDWQKGGLDAQRSLETINNLILNQQQVSTDCGASANPESTQNDFLLRRDTPLSFDSGRKYETQKDKREPGITVGTEEEKWHIQHIVEVGGMGNSGNMVDKMATVNYLMLKMATKYTFWKALLQKMPTKHVSKPTQKTLLAGSWPPCAAPTEFSR